MKGLSGFRKLRYRGIPIYRDDRIPSGTMYLLNENNFITKNKKGNPFMEITIEKAKNGYVLRVERGYGKNDVYIFKTMEEMTAEMPRIVVEAEAAMEAEKQKSQEDEE